MTEDSQENNFRGWGKTAISMMVGFALIWAAMPMSAEKELRPSDKVAMSSRQKNVQLVNMQRTVLVPATGEFPRNMGADIIELQDGTLFLAFSQWLKGAHDDNDSQVCGMLSSDSGTTWGKPFLLVGTCKDFSSVRMPCLFRLKGGQLVMVLRVRAVTDTWVGMVHCKDERQLIKGEVNWTKPVRISPPPPGIHILLNNRAVRLRTGRLLIPVSSPWPWDRKDTQGTDIRSWCLLSDDDGVSWYPSSTILKGPKRGLMEPYVVELTDGRLLMFMRTQMNTQYQSFSKDGGKTWSEAEPSKLISPESPAAVRRDPKTGLLTVIWNHNKMGRHCQDRTPLTVAFSKDEGQTWFEEVNLEDDSSTTYSYPSLNFIDGYAFVTYYEWVPKGRKMIPLILRRFKVQLSP